MKLLGETLLACLSAVCYAAWVVISTHARPLQQCAVLNNGLSVMTVLRGVGMSAFNTFFAALCISFCIIRAVAAACAMLQEKKQQAMRKLLHGDSRVEAISILSAAHGFQLPLNVAEFERLILPQQGAHQFMLPTTHDVYRSLTCCNTMVANLLQVAADCSVVRAFNLALTKECGQNAHSELESIQLMHSFHECAKELNNVVHPSMRLETEHTYHFIKDGYGQTCVDTVTLCGGLSMQFGMINMESDCHSGWVALQQKLHGGLPSFAYGGIEWVPVYVASSHHLQFGIVNRQGKVQAVGPLLDLNDPEARAAALYAEIMCHIVIRMLLETAPPRDHRRYIHYDYNYFDKNTLIRYTPPVIEKEVRHFHTYLEENDTSFAAVQAAHRCSSTCPHSVHSRSIEFDQRSGQYKVVMDDVGWPCEWQDESDYQRAAHAVLNALNHLQRQSPPLLHCDIRRDNIMECVRGNLMLVDLELAHHSPWTPKRGVWLPAWDTGKTGTLDGGKYTLRSELYEIGKLLLKYRSLSLEGQAFAAQLMSKELSLEDALAHEYMRKAA